MTFFLFSDFADFADSDIVTTPLLNNLIIIFDIGFISGWYGKICLATQHSGGKQTWNKSMNTKSKSAWQRNSQNSNLALEIWKRALFYLKPLRLKRRGFHIQSRSICKDVSILYQHISATSVCCTVICSILHPNRRYSIQSHPLIAQGAKIILGGISGGIGDLEVQAYWRRQMFKTCVFFKIQFFYPAKIIFGGISGEFEIWRCRCIEENKCLNHVYFSKLNSILPPFFSILVSRREHFGSIQKGFSRCYNPSRSISCWSWCIEENKYLNI